MCWPAGTREPAPRHCDVAADRAANLVMSFEALGLGWPSTGACPMACSGAGAGPKPHRFQRLVFCLRDNSNGRLTGRFGLGDWAEALRA